MGASNSTPQTASFANPAPTRSVGPAIQVTPNVIHRLENAKRQATEAQCAACGNKQQQHDSVVAAPPSLLQLKSDELEEMQFNKTIEKLETMLGKPIYWAEHCEADLNKMRRELIKCNSQYREEPLRCAQMSKEFQDYVFNEQFKAILKFKEITPSEQQPGRES